MVSSNSRWPRIISKGGGKITTGIPGIIKAHSLGAVKNQLEHKAPGDAAAALTVLVRDERGVGGHTRLVIPGTDQAPTSSTVKIELENTAGPQIEAGCSARAQGISVGKPRAALGTQSLGGR